MAGGRIVIARGVGQAMRAAVIAGGQNEVCAAVFGVASGGGGWRASRFRMLANLAVEPTLGFVVDPLELCSVDGEERDRGQRLLGLFHSHPSGDPRPSQRDRAASWPGIACWIAAFDRRGRFRLACLPLVGDRLPPTASATVPRRDR